MKTSFCVLALLLVFPFHATAREWTNAADGKKIEAEFVSSDGANVTIKMGAKEFTIPISRFSEADQAFVKEQMARAKAKANEPKPMEGAYTDKFTSDWVLAEHDGLPYAIFGAEDLDGSKKYPLLVSLHGKSSNNENGKHREGQAASGCCRNSMILSKVGSWSRLERFPFLAVFLTTFFDSAINLRIASLHSK